MDGIEAAPRGLVKPSSLASRGQTAWLHESAPGGAEAPRCGAWSQAVPDRAPHGLASRCQAVPLRSQAAGPREPTPLRLASPEVTRTSG